MYIQLFVDIGIYSCIYLFFLLSNSILTSTFLMYAFIMGKSYVAAAIPRTLNTFLIHTFSPQTKR